MELYKKFQVREINRKLFANDIVYSDNENGDMFISLISNIIQEYNPEDALANVPTILEVKDDNINSKTLDRIKLLSKNSVYLQFNSRVLPDADKSAIIRTLKDSGYKIVIELNQDDKIFTVARMLADVVKLDIHGIPVALNNKSNGFKCKILAYNVNSAEDYALAELSGISLYEGTYIGEAQETKVENHLHSNANFLEIIVFINKDGVNVQELAEIISRDALMSAQVIRLSNSNYFSNVKNRVKSVKEAIERIGLESLKRWLFLLQFTKNDSVPEDLLQMCYYRAIFCRKVIHAAGRVGITEDDAYLIGLFSTLDSLTGRPLDSELSSLNISEKVIDTLIYRDGAGGTLLNLVKAHEEANTNRIKDYAKQLKLSEDKVYQIYSKSVEEARSVWQRLTQLGGVY